MNFNKITITNGRYEIETKEYTYVASCFDRNQELIIKHSPIIGIKLFRVNRNGDINGAFQDDFTYGKINQLAHSSKKPINYISICSSGYHFYTLDQLNIGNTSFLNAWAHDCEVIPFVIEINTPYIKGDEKSVCSDFKFIKSLDLTKKTLLSHFPYEYDHYKKYNEFIVKYLKKPSDRLSHHYVEFNVDIHADRFTYFDILKNLALN